MGKQMFLIEVEDDGSASIRRVLTEGEARRLLGPKTVPVMRMCTDDIVPATTVPHLGLLLADKRGDR